MFIPIKQVHNDMQTVAGMRTTSFSPKLLRYLNIVIYSYLYVP
jgi:hypothetical protein